MMVAGVVREMTAASAKRAALGAGAIVMDVIASNDKRRPHEQIQRIRELRPDMVLLSGGNRWRQLHPGRAAGRTGRASQAAAAVRRRSYQTAHHLRGQRPRPGSEIERVFGESRDDSMGGFDLSSGREPAADRSSRRTSDRPATGSTTSSSSTSWPMLPATTS